MDIRKVFERWLMPVMGAFFLIIGGSTLLNIPISPLGFGIHALLVGVCCLAASPLFRE